MVLVPRSSNKHAWATDEMKLLQYIFKQKLNNISVEFGNHFDNEAECTAGTYNINAPDRPDVCTNWYDFCCWNTFLDQLQIEMSNSVNALKEKGTLS